MQEIFTDTGKFAIMLVFGIPIVAIVCGSISGIVKMIITHRERVKMIESGFHPDYPPDDEEDDDDTEDY